LTEKLPDWKHDHFLPLTIPQSGLHLRQHDVIGRLLNDFII